MHKTPTKQEVRWVCVKGRPCVCSTTHLSAYSVSFPSTAVAWQHESGDLLIRHVHREAVSRFDFVLHRKRLLPLGFFHISQWNGYKKHRLGENTGAASLLFKKKKCQFVLHLICLSEPESCKALRSLWVVVFCRCLFFDGSSCILIILLQVPLKKDSSRFP